MIDEAYVRMLEDAILKGEQFVADVAASRCKGYSPRPLYEAADEIRKRREQASG